MTNKSRFDVEVVVTDKGTTKLVEKNLKGLGTATQDTSGQFRTANKHSSDFFDTQKKGIIGTANSTRSFSKLAESIGRGGSSGLVGAYATLAANTFAVTAAFSALRSASQVEQIFKGLEAAGNRTGKSLTGTAKALKDVTGSAISTEQAMRSTAQIASAGFGSDAIVRLGKAAKDTSFALGRNITDSLDRLSRGIVKLEPELLDELGIMTKLGESNSLYASQLGKTETQLTNFEKRQGFLNVVLAEAELKFGGLSAQAGDSTNYDKLAATFTDLSNSVLNSINLIAKPIAGILASSYLVMGGAAVLFASTLKNQLAPELLNSAVAASKAAAKYKEDAIAKSENIAITRDYVRAQREAEIASIANVSLLGDKGPKAYKNLASSIKDGTASVEEYKKAIISLERSQRANQTIVENNPSFAANTEAGKAKRLEIENTKEQINQIKRLQEARAIAASEDLSKNAQVLSAKKEALLAATLARREEAASNALSAASHLDYKQSLAGIKQAVAEHRLGLIQSAEAASIDAGALKTALTPALITGKTAFYTFALSAKAAGVALLNAIPMIGQLLFVLGLLKTGWDAIKSEAVKKAEKAFDDFNEVAAKSVGYLSEINRATASTASLSLRTAAAMTIQANAMSEIADKMNAVIETSKMLNNIDIKKAESGIAGFWESLMSNKNEISYRLEIDKTSKAFEILGNSIPNVSSLSNENRSVVKTFADIYKQAPQATEEIIKFYGGMENLSKLPFEQKFKAMANIVNTVTDKFRGGAERVEALQQAFKALDQSMSDFTLGSVLTTKYDSVVKNFDSVTMAIYDLKTAADKTGNQDWSKLLTGIGSGTSSLLNIDTQKSLQAFKSADLTVQSLKLQKETLGSLNSSEEVRLRASERILSTNKELFSSIENQIGSSRTMFLNAQKLERTYKSQADLLTAQMQANQSLFTAAGAGVKARICGEEKIRGLQVAQLKSELVIQEQLVAKANARIVELKAMDAQIAANEALLSQGNRFTKQALEQQLAAKGVGNFYDIVKGNMTGTNYLIGVTQGRIDRATEEQRVVANMITGYKQLSDFEKDTAEQKKASERELLTLNNSIRDGEAAVLNLKTQINVLNTQNLTSAQKLAQIRQADGEFQRSVLQTLEEQRNIAGETTSVYENIDSIINGTTDSLREQLDLVKKSAVAQRETAIIASKKQQSELLDQLRLAKANGARATDADQKKAAEILVQNIETQLRLEKQGLEIKLGQVEAQEALAKVQKTQFDTSKEGMEWQKTSLDMLQKELDVRRSIKEEAIKSEQARIKLSYQRIGLEMSPEGSKALEIRTATQAYKIAVEEVSLKKALIDLEYALLDAQKEQLLENLRVRRQEIDANDPRNYTRVAQLDSSISRLGGLDMSAAAQTAKNVLDKQIENSRIELQSAMTNTVKQILFGDLIASARGYQEKARAREEALYVLKNATATKEEKIVKAESEAQKSANALSQNPVVSSNNALILTINKWINSIEKFLEVSPTNLSGSTTILEAQANALKQGLYISEKVGEMTAKHTGRGHPEGRAFDASIAGGNADSTNPVYRAKMDKIAQDYQAQGLVVLWNGNRYDPNGSIEKLAKGANQHTDHMHVEIQAGITKAISSIDKSATKTAKYAIQKIEETDAILESRVSVAPNGPSVVNTPELGSTITETLVTGAPSLRKDFSIVEDILAKYNTATALAVTGLEKLGPEGELVAGVVTGMGNIAGQTIGAFKVIEESNLNLATKIAEGTATTQDYLTNTADKITAVASVVSTALSTISSAVASSAQAKEQAIQKEIDAEQRRDGKSAESVAKIQALEKRKDEIAKKQFNTNKKLMMAQAIIATATGVAQALTYGPIAGPILAGLIGALGAAQLAIIAGTSYQSASATASAANTTPTTLTIGKRGDTVDLAKQNSNVGGEIGYLRGSKGVGTNASNYSVIGSAYGGELPRGYGNTAYVVGEKGPETILPDTPITVKPSNDNSTGTAPLTATINISAIDSKGVAEMLIDQKGNIISMLREAANANGQSFLESVNTNVYTRPNVSKL